MKLKSYQQGGGLIYTPFIPEQYAGQQTSKSSSDEDEPKLDPLDKELIGLMKDQSLLPSDIQEILAAVTQFQRRTQSLSSTAGFGGTGSYRSVMPGMMQIMSRVSQAKFNKEQWGKAVSEIEKHNANAEVALDSYGRMYVSEDGAIKLVTPDEFDPEKHLPISNSQLLNLRERVYGFNETMLNDLVDVIGMDDVRSSVDDIIKNFGTIKSSKYQKKVMQDIAEDLNSPDGIYKITEKYSKAELEDFSSLVLAQLPKQAQNLLKANAAISGYKPLDFIRSIIQTNTSIESDVDYDASASKAMDTGGSGSSSSDSLTHDTYEEHLVSGQALAPEKWIAIQPKNAGTALYAYAQDAGPILKDSRRFDSANLNEIFKYADGIGAIVDAENIQFGDQLLGMQDFPKVVYDNSSNMKRVWLPVKEDASGHIVIDFEAQQKVQDLQNYVDENGYISDALIEERLEDIPNAYWDRDKKRILFRNSKPYLMIHGYASSDKIRFDTNSPYILNVEKGQGDSRKDIKQIYNNAISTGTSTEGKAQYDYGKAAGRHLYEGNIYMPISNELIGTHVFNYEYASKTRYMNTTQKAALAEKARTGIFNF